MVDAAFGQRRKTLRAALAGWAGSAAGGGGVLRAAGVDPARAARRWAWPSSPASPAVASRDVETDRTALPHDG